MILLKLIRFIKDSIIIMIHYFQNIIFRITNWLGEQCILSNTKGMARFFKSMDCSLNQREVNLKEKSGVHSNDLRLTSYDLQKFSGQLWESAPT